MSNNRSRARRSCLAALAAALAGPWLALAQAASLPAAQPEPGLEQLDQACETARQRGEIQAVRALQRRLLLVRPAPQPLPVVLANADALLRCGAPDSALVVLNRYSPQPGAEQIQWSLVQWRAANAALDHRLAAAALRQLAAASGTSLALLQVPVQLEQGGRWRQQLALDLLADHLDAQGLREQAAQVLLANPGQGVLAAQRLAQAVAWSSTMPLAVRQRWLEQALEQAAAAGAWGLAAALLDQQLALLDAQPSPQRRKLEERRRRLGLRIDDEQASAPHALRSPRDPGGHAAASPP